MPKWAIGVPCQTFGGGVVGMDNSMMYDGVLVWDKLTIIEFTSSEYPQILPFEIPNVEGSITG